MGYSKREGTDITDFWPDDSDGEKYLSTSSINLQEIIDVVEKMWPTIALDEIEISSEKIHTHCIYYDRYDPSDYTDFIVLRCNDECVARVKEYFRKKEFSEKLEEYLPNKEKITKIKI